MNAAPDQNHTEQGPVFQAWLTRVSRGLSAPARDQVARDALNELRRRGAEASDISAQTLASLGDPAELNAQATRVHLREQDARTLTNLADVEREIDRHPEKSVRLTFSLILPALLVCTALVVVGLPWAAAAIVLILTLATVTRPGRYRRLPYGLRTPAQHREYGPLMLMIPVVFFGACSLRFLGVLQGHVTHPVPPILQGPVPLALGCLYLAGLLGGIVHFLSLHRTLGRRLERSLPDGASREAWLRGLATNADARLDIDLPVSLQEAAQDAVTQDAVTQTAPLSGVRDLNTWLALACQGLADPARQMITRELRRHLIDAAEDGQTEEQAVIHLGDPLTARDEYAGVHLSHSDWNEMVGHLPSAAFDAAAQDAAQEQDLGQPQDPVRALRLNSNEGLDLLPLGFALMLATGFAFSGQPFWSVAALLPPLAERLSRPPAGAVNPLLENVRRFSRSVVTGVLVALVPILSTCAQPIATLISWHALLLAPLLALALAGFIIVLFWSHPQDTARRLTVSLPDLAGSPPPPPETFTERLSPWLSREAQTRRRDQEASDVAAAAYARFPDTAPLPGSPDALQRLRETWNPRSPWNWEQRYWQPFAPQGRPPRRRA